MNKVYKGIIKTFNGSFGFIKSELGETYFHKSGVISKIIIDKGDEVEFKVEPSPKKEGSFQGYDIAIIKKIEKPLFQFGNQILGILTLFNEDKGFGLIGTTENVDYFFHNTNMVTKYLRIRTGDVLIFQEKKEEGKKIAYNCRLVNDYKDFKIALDYLSKEDNVIIKEKVLEKVYRGKMHYSMQDRKVSLLKKAVFQILNDKSIDERQKFISDYFLDELTDKSPQEQLNYFIFIKTIFENRFKNDKTLILSSFFSRHFDFLLSHKDFKYILWLEGYIEETELDYIAKQIINESIGPKQNLIEKIFRNLTEPNDQETVLNKFLELIGNIDNEEKYSKIKLLAGLSEMYKKANEKFLTSVYSQSDIGRQYLMWLEGYTAEKNLSYIATQITNESIGSYPNPFKKIFGKLTEPNEQETVLNKFLELIGNIDNEEKYSKIKSLVGLPELDEKVNEAFLISVYRQSDIERQYMMWLEGYTAEKNLSYIATQITNESIGSYPNPFKKIFGKLTEPNDQEAVLNEFLELIGNIDNEEKYSKIKPLAGLPELDEKVNKEFLISVYRQSDIERQYLMWLDGYTEEKNLNYIAKKITNSTYSTPFAKIFGNLTEPNDQETVLNEFLELIGNIDNEEKYSKIKSLAGLPELDEKVNEEFLISVYRQSDIERQYLMWLDGYTEEKNLNYIAKKITNKSTVFYQNPFEEIFARLTEPNEQETVLNKFLEFIVNIDNGEKYSRVKSLAELFVLDENVKDRFLNSVYDNSDIERRYLMWLEGYTQEKDLNTIAEQIIENKVSIGSHQSPFRKIFEKLTEPNEQEIVLNRLLELIGNIDNEEKYNRVKSVAGLSELNENVKDRFLNSTYNNSDVNYQSKLFIDYWQFSEKDKHALIINLFNGLDITSFYLFCLELLKPLAKINTSYYFKGCSYLKIHLRYKDYIRATNARYGKSSIFIYNGILLNEKHFEIKIEFFKIISSYIEKNINSIEIKIKEIIEIDNLDLISKFLNTFSSFKSSYIQICSDLEIKEFNIPIIEPYVVNFCDEPKLLKFWIYDLIEYFNFNTYCYYYFTLSLEERKIFNKKAKAKMGEEIKTSMLKKREPWTFVGKSDIDDNIEIKYYTCTWKSIWFGDGFIRICMDDKPSFSQQFKWDFSEEKFNFLYEYISGKRLKDLKITAYGNLIKSIEGLDDLEELIWKILIIQEVEKSNGITTRGVGTNRVPVNMLLRNQCIQLLNNFQLKELEPTRVLEKTFNPITGGIGVDVSLLYSIPINKYEVAIIWESLELEKSKATHIFKCNRTEYESIFSEIENYLSGNLKVRSTLNSNDIDAIGHQKKLRYLCRIEHDNFNFSKWETSLYDILPELKSFLIVNEQDVSL